MMIVILHLILLELRGIQLPYVRLRMLSLIQSSPFGMLKLINLNFIDRILHPLYLTNLQVYSLMSYLFTRCFQQLQWLYNAYGGIFQVMPSTLSHSPLLSVPMTLHQTTAEAIKPAIANGHQKAEAIYTNGWDNLTSSDTMAGAQLHNQREPA
ncbi:uncharacterized protein LOC123224075 isoform X1 [Mangifera indica]|uniref:uncharacterized protein LOC123224075 isoform X1 n=1 Tax=Mangifera indica TaxID=29780 RepID=UPI001CFAB46F|nr:uncharacterized protein LOC123224075 isoform X1 [Mangifera indica]